MRLSHKALPEFIFRCALFSVICLICECGWAAESLKSEVVNNSRTEQFFQTGSNSIMVVTTDITNIGSSADVDRTNVHAKKYEPLLRLLLSSGETGPFPKEQVKGYHVPVFFVKDVAVPKPARTNVVDLLCSHSRSNIVMLVLDNGPLYHSTNSGLTWEVFDKPGKYRFRLTGSEETGGFLAAAEIHAVTNSTPNPLKGLPKENWYVVGGKTNEDQEVLIGGPSQSAPVLLISRSPPGVVLSWPASSGSFILQECTELGGSDWVNVTNSVTVVGGRNQVVIKNPTGNYFYRLKGE